MNDTHGTEHGGRRAHQPDQTSIRGLILFGIGLFSTIGIVLFLVGYSFWLLSQKAAKNEPPPPPLAGSQVPPAPRLQPNPQLELKQMRTQEEQHLETYRWINRPAGTIAIPIERAIDLLSAQTPKGAAKQ